MTSSMSLDSRRPQFLRDVVGNRAAKRRLSAQMERGTIPRRAFLFGPTGAGKTTISRILGRHFFCRNRVGIGDPCGECDRCKGDLTDHYLYNQWTAARLSSEWKWWEAYRDDVLGDPDRVFFLDEAQDLTEAQQKTFYDTLESAEAVVIFATTHRHEIKDALVNRFGANVYELVRPTAEECVAHLRGLCRTLGVRADDDQLARVVAHYQHDLRKCVDFAHVATEQAPAGVVSSEYVNAVLGTGAVPVSTGPAGPARRAPML